jgi:hypothetical protein
VNYLAHGFRHTADPWLCAGTALPDWARVLSAPGQHLRVPEDTAALFASDADAQLASLARGVVRHHADDRVFHQSAEFDAAVHDAMDALRPLRALVPGVRIRFLAHVGIEMLMDAALVDEEPARVERYYDALAQVDGAALETRAQRLANGPMLGMANLFEVFLRSRFLAEYGDDARVAHRLDQVATRIGHPPCGDALVPFLPALRDDVRRRLAGLVAPALRAEK